MNSFHGRGNEVSIGEQAIPPPPPPLYSTDLYINCQQCHNAAYMQQI